MIPFIAGLLSVAIVPNGQGFACTPTRVWDGDGPIWCEEGPRIRLEGIAAREIDGSCRPGHPCPDASGIKARDTLVKLLGGSRGKTSSGHILVSAPTMHCQSGGSGKGARTAAWCSLPGVGDLSCAMVRSGAAARWPRYGGNKVCREGRAVGRTSRAILISAADRDEMSTKGERRSRLGQPFA